MQRHHALQIALAALLATSTALGEPKPLSEKRSTSYYGWHTGLTALGFGVSGLELLLGGNHGVGADWSGFVLDDPVKMNFSDSASARSDAMVFMNVTLPVLAQMSSGFDTSMANATLIYAEAQSITFLLTTTTKLLVRRPRPYTHSQDPRIIEFKNTEGPEANVSFFSGHSSASFTAATSGAILYSARTDDLWARRTMWGVEFMLAAATAQLRVRAGRHYRTDVWTGTAVGLAVGYLVPKLHGVQTSRVEGSELAIAGIAGGATMLLGELCDIGTLLSFAPSCGQKRDVRVPVQPSRDETTGARWFVLPAAFVGGGGLQIMGDL